MMESKEEKSKILLCEDNDVNIKVAKALMKNFEFQFDIAKNGQEAVDKFLPLKYDMILMDCIMPVIDGFEATQKIRAIEKEQNIEKPTLIFAMTANASEFDKEKCLNIGMDDFIEKPIRRATLEEKFRKWGVLHQV